MDELNPMNCTEELLRMKTDELKLKTTRNLSIAFSRFFSLFVIMIMLMLVLLAFAFGGVLLLGDIIGSYAAGAFIVGGIFLVALIVLLCLRKKLFLNSFVRLFIKMFYGED
ncbi:MAG: hypothetical protein ACI4QG_02715 [Candidatus Cryptobacteroides sp.]